MCSEKARVLAAWRVPSQAFRSAPRLSMKSFLRWWSKERVTDAPTGEAVLVTDASGGVDLRTVT
jgi:hypothetical protein